MVIATKNEPARMILAELRREASLEKAHESKKMFITKKLIGEENLHKLLCFILKDFQTSLKITNPANEMDASEIFEAADRLMGMNEGEYGRESVFDVIMALKHFKRNPFELYNSFKDEYLTKIMVNYLTVKAEWLERHNSQAKRESMQKPPLTVEQIQLEYELSKAGLPTVGDNIQQQRKYEELGIPKNWRKDSNYKTYLIQRQQAMSQAAEEIPFEDLPETEPTDDLPTTERSTES